LLKLTHRKNLFLLLMIATAGGSAALYGAMDGSFVTKTIQVVLLQQVVGAAIYFACFGVNSWRSGSPFE
jgi:hypothetical protein